MDITTHYNKNSDALIALFAKTFTVSEGAEEGQVIKGLVADMLTSVSADDLYVFTALDGTEVLGSIILTRMRYEQDTRKVFILSPVAVATTHQRKGVGQTLINHALNALKAAGVDAVLTYGDINFYSKVGFQQITEAQAKAPLPLQYPEGWLGQSLQGPKFEPLTGPSACVAPLDDPNYW